MSTASKLKPVDKMWVDGNLVPFASAQVPVLTHTLHYGLGAFEGIRAYKRADGKTAIFRLKEHIERLYDSCKLVLMEPRFSREVVEKGCVDMMKANGIDEAYL